MVDAWDSFVLEPGDAPGAFSTTIHRDWTVSTVPQGGMVAALAVAAMERCLPAGDQRARSVSCVFAGPVAAGPVTIEVSVLRAGRSMSQMCATVRSVGASAGLTAIAVFGSRREGYDFTEVSAPSAPPPLAVRSWRDPLPAGVDVTSMGGTPPFWARVLESREVIGTKPWEPFTPGRAEGLGWYRFDQHDRALAAPGWAAALVCLDTMPGAVWERTGGEWMGPSADLTAHLYQPPTSEWLLSHTTARWAGDGYATVDNALWEIDHADGPTLVAWGTQTMFFAFAR